MRVGLSPTRVRFSLALLVILGLGFCAPRPRTLPDPRASPRGSGPAPLLFHRTTNSDEWVARTLHIQAREGQVLVVASDGMAPRTLRIPRLDLNARPDAKDSGQSSQRSARRSERPRAADERPVARVFRTLQEAADAAQGGDLVAVLPGSYEGFVIGDKPDAGDGRYVRFTALGRPGAVVIDRPARVDGGRWMVLFRTAHHVILEGFQIAGHSRPEADDPKAPWAGIMLDGDFAHSGALTHHVVIVGNFSHHHRKWGLHSTDTHTVLLQDNLFAFSAREHSAYVSDGSDNYVIRRNVFFGSRASGLQCNLDPISSLDELGHHPALVDAPPPAPTRAWALDLIERATRRFGPRGFPDGRGENFIIEENVINQNGAIGGGALNLAGLEDSLIQNNLLYDNHAHGIAQWDDGNPFDRPYVDPGPATAEAFQGPDSLPLWGCRRNLIRNNTVFMRHRTRAALQSVHGSWGTRLYNNILINEVGPSIEVTNTGIYRFEAVGNVVNRVVYSGSGVARSLLRLATTPPDEHRNVLGVGRERIAQEFVRYGEEPWILIEDGWWRLNPARPDFHPRVDSRLLARTGEQSLLPGRDLEGARRGQADIGAFRVAR